MRTRGPARAGRTRVRNAKSHNVRCLMASLRIGNVFRALALGAVLLAGLRFALPVAASGGGPAPGSHAFGGNLAACQATYWYASFGVLPVATDDNGNSVVDHVALLALPPAYGDGT